MKHLIYSLLLLTLITSCKQDVLTTTPLASLSITNTIVGGADAKLRGEPLTTIYNNGTGYFSLLTGSQDLYVYPQADSLHPYYHSNNKEMMNAGQIYSLFLGGTLDAVTSLLVHENEFTERDNNIRVRIVNLSPGCPPINVSLSTSTSVNEFSEIDFAE
ncbi:MAG: DUF4397 domain-containing protein, partial [Chitinophagaceae bacterium]|nr:DUF4397 domain-containing protein [Chitinophagaceae bacterium]